MNELLLSAEYWCRRFKTHIGNIYVEFNLKLANLQHSLVYSLEQLTNKSNSYFKIHYCNNLAVLNPNKNGGHQLPFRSLISRQEWSILPMVVLMQVSRELSQAGGEALEASGVMRGNLSPRVPSTAVTCSLSAGIINKSKNCLFILKYQKQTSFHLLLFYYMIRG